MHPVGKRYFALTSEEKKAVQIHLCERALSVWEKHIEKKKIIRYREHVCGTLQTLDATLLSNALDAVKSNNIEPKIEERFLEPVAALQDLDLKLPREVEDAFYSIYNLYRHYLLNTELDNWLIVNQALSALGEELALENLEQAIEDEA